MTSWMLLTVGCAVLILLFLSARLLRREFRVVTVFGESMVPSLANGERVLIRRCGVSGLSRGDIVVLHADRPLGWPKGRPVLLGEGVVIPLIKRVVALPGERIPEDLDAAPGVFSGPVVPPDSVVVVGDNARVSRDSRQYGHLPAEWVTGKMIRKLSSKEDRAIAD
ncbi:S26 family signal peptidase [Planomonospora corallina]|uniref:signal peptidase I n=1 Tax=Planomonospora corallina TaxID=1806052 RepID=A0ABV8I9T3_9ACTN